jgi:hypothetical protein
MEVTAKIICRPIESFSILRDYSKIPKSFAPRLAVHKRECGVAADDCIVPEAKIMEGTICGTDPMTLVN